MVDKSDKEDRFRCEIDFSEIEASNYNPLAWLIRPCEWYQQEYRDCISIRARVHQYFIFGKIDSCDSWRDDYYNCNNFRKTKDPNLMNKLIQSEIERKEFRFSQSKANDIWEYRTEPPSDWNRPVNKPQTES
ncbi:hypothetical protein BLOT_016262 [Blomia tropicalis]|nr:hypothetical protein BLOT_016262 [Blomia tropicalis]